MKKLIFFWLFTLAFMKVNAQSLSNCVFYTEDGKRDFYEKFLMRDGFQLGRDSISYYFEIPDSLTAHSFVEWAKAQGYSGKVFKGNTLGDIKRTQKLSNWVHIERKVETLDFEHFSAQVHLLDEKKYQMGITHCGSMGTTGIPKKK